MQSGASSTYQDYRRRAVLEYANLRYDRVSLTRVRGEKMRTNISVQKRKFNDLPRASVFIGQFGQEMCYAFLFSQRNGEPGVLVLEGSEVGKVMPPVIESVLAFIEQPVVILSSASEHWSPSRPVSGNVQLCLTDKDLYFSVNLGAQKSVISVDTGEVLEAPYRSLYASRWALQIPGEAEPYYMRVRSEDR